jgi:hypothetical protein
MVETLHQLYRDSPMAGHVGIHAPLRRGFAPHFINYKRGCTRLAAASDKVYQLFAHGRWWARTHAVLVIGLYELLDPTT